MNEQFAASDFENFINEVLVNCQNPSQAKPEICQICQPKLIDLIQNRKSLIPAEKLISIVLQLAKCHIFKNQLSEAEKLLREAQELVNRGCEYNKPENILHFQAMIHWRKGKLDEALDLFQSIIPIYVNNGDHETAAGTCLNISSILHLQGLTEQSLEYVQKAVDGYKLTPNLAMYHMSRSNLANILSGLGRYTEAIEFKKETIEYFSSVKNDMQLALEYNSISTFYYKMNQLEPAIENALKSAEIRDKLNDMLGIAFTWLNLGLYYCEFQQQSLALYYYQKALKIFKKTDNSDDMAKVLNNIGNIYMEQNDYAKALSNFNKALSLHEKIGNKAGISNVLHNIGIIQAEHYKDYANAMIYQEKAATLAEEIEDFHLFIDTKLEISSLLTLQGRIEEAALLLKDIDKLIKENNRLEYNAKIFKAWEDLYRKQGKYKQAYSMLKNGVEELKKQHSDAIIAKIAEMQTRYETEKKEQEAEIYRLKNIELEEKNRLIEAQKSQLQETLTKLQNSEIRYNFVSDELFSNVKTTLIGKSEAINNITKMIALVAKSDKTNVLITGETGTGKEIVARNIHAASKRGKLHFYAVNCSAVPETLFESQFFGHEKDAFTGANTAKIGWFEIANRSTLFLDEIGNLSLDQQAKLLRTLEEHQIIRIGSHKEIPVDVRIISATNLNLIDKVNRDEFRRDLYHRLAIFVIHIPSLRERKDEIPLLLDHFVGLSSQAMNKRINKVEKDVVKHLLDYDYPGNVRELKNMVERAILIADSSTLRLRHFSIPVSGSDPISASGLGTLQDMEQQLISKTLKSTGFNRAQAAKLLGVERKVVERKIKKYNILPE